MFTSKFDVIDGICKDVNFANLFISSKKSYQTKKHKYFSKIIMNATYDI